MSLSAEPQWTARSEASVDSNKHVAIRVRLAIGQHWQSSDGAITIKLISISKEGLATLQVTKGASSEPALTSIKGEDIPHQIIENAILVKIDAASVIMELHGADLKSQAENIMPGQLVKPAETPAPR